MSGNYDEALFFYVDYGAGLYPIKIATLRLIDIESFINDVDPDYSSNISHILFLASDMFNELDDFGVNQRSNSGGYAVIYVRLDKAQKSLSLVNSWSMTDYYPDSDPGSSHLTF